MYFNHVYDTDLNFILLYNPIIKCCRVVDSQFLIPIIYCLKVMRYSFSVKMVRNTFNSSLFPTVIFFKSGWVNRHWLILVNMLIWLHFDFQIGVPYIIKKKRNTFSSLLSSLVYKAKTNSMLSVTDSLCSKDKERLKGNKW